MNPNSRALKGAGIKFVLPPERKPVAEIAREASSLVDAALLAKRPLPRTGIALTTATIRGNHELREEVERLKSERGAAKLDPKLIVRSSWANRNEAEFATPEFAQLREEIASAGGNIQPIKVRPTHVDVNGVRHFEIIYGHRRHQACSELGFPVLVLIGEATDQELFAEMDRENRGRKNLSLYEQGASYKRALDLGLFPSRRRLAESLGVNLALVVQAVQLAGLPDDLIAAFSSPLDIQVRWAKPLTDAFERDPKGVLQRAKMLAAERKNASPAEVLQALTGSTKEAPAELSISSKGKRLAVLKTKPGGAVSIEFAVGALAPRRHVELAKLLRDFLER